MRASLPAFAACLLLLTGCMANLPVTTTTAYDPAQALAPVGAAAGTAATHATPVRFEGEVVIHMQGTQYVASRNVTITNDFGGAAQAALELATQNGAIDAHAGGTGGYRLTANLEGRGQTEQQARDALASMEVLPSDKLDAGRLELGLTVQFNDYSAAGPLPPLPIQTGSSGRGASLVAVLPAQPNFEATAATSNGAIQIEGLHGRNLSLDSSNGALTVQGSWDNAKLDTSNGAISLDGIFNDVDAGTSNGAVDTNTTATRTAAQHFDTANGAVTIELAAKDGTGFDCTATTSNGKASVTLPDNRISASGHVRASSNGFDQKAIQLTVTAKSSNARVSIEAK